MTKKSITVTIFGYQMHKQRASFCTVYWSYEKAYLAAFSLSLIYLFRVYRVPGESSEAEQNTGYTHEDKSKYKDI